MHDTKSLNVSIKMSQPQLFKLQIVNFHKQNCTIHKYLKQ